MSETYSTMDSLREISRRITELAGVAYPDHSTQLALMAEAGVLSKRLDELQAEQPSTTRDALQLLASRIKQLGLHVFGSVLSTDVRDAIEWFAAELSVSHLPPLKDDEPAFHLNSTRSVAVGKERFISDFTDCPRGAKVQLLNPGGVAIYGIYDGDPQWTAWYPVPGSPE